MKTDNIKKIVDDIKLVAKIYNQNELSRSEYLQRGEFSQYDLYDNGNTWGELCKLAGITTKSKEEVSDEIYFKRLSKAVKISGRYPKTSERKKFGLNMSKRRYPTLIAFIKKAVKLGKVENLFKKETKKDFTERKQQDDIAILIKESLKEKSNLRSTPPIPFRTKRKKWQRTGISGFPYAPQEEQGVLALFSIFCSQRILPWQILDLRGGKGLDATCYDEKNKKEIQVELKYLLSKGSWNHEIDKLDFVVCWENRWKNFPKPVIELSKLIKNL